MTPPQTRTESGRALHGGHCRYPENCDLLAAILAIETEAAGAALAALRAEVRWLNPMMRGDEAVKAVAWLRAEILAVIDKLSGAAPATGEE